ncbi:MAG: outer membrane channel protein TolC [Rheinheimera sp.]|uniref:outer membrane channel protein TolC n=1 Tax=Arsukibacterium sp. UBA3155 TaxID=1946058 RepID=UPI000C8ADA03|nr:outer membrane channel protein TolC [Arsukibacterium sp. UBA3155]MAD75505.1 outer membrane channel protein TolC [Rheinheimera sp.]|tara:strand:- start:86553 stop:87911 length:1359 start_codon:yes stop_codon:yes gene_type:complete
MKKTFLSTLILSSLTVFSVSALAADLTTVYQLAIQKDPQLLKAEAVRNAARERIDISKARLLPQVNLTAGYSKSINERQGFVGDELTIIESDTTGWSAEVGLSQSVFDWTNWKNLNTAEKLAMQSQTILDAEIQGLIVRVSQAYFNVLEAVDGLSFAEAEKRAIERQLEQTKQRFAVGLTAITDVHEAQAQFDSAVAREIAAQNLVETARETLREITGQYHSELASLDTDKFDTVQPSPTTADAWVQLAEQLNLNIKANKLALEIAQNDIENAKAGHYPTLSLDAAYGTGDDESTSTFLGTSLPTNPPRLDNKRIGLNLRVPLYSGGGTVAATDVAKANYVAASQDLEQSYRTAVRQVRVSFNDINANIATIRALEQAVISADSALNATDAGFEVGTRTIVDVLQSTRNLFEARRNLSAARYNYVIAILSLKQAAGNLSEQDLLAINQALVE